MDPPNKEMTMSHEDHPLSNATHSPNKTPPPEDTAKEDNHIKLPPSATHCRVRADTNREGLVILDRGLIPYKMVSLNVAHAHILVL